MNNRLDIYRHCMKQISFNVMLYLIETTCINVVNKNKVISM